MDRLLRMCGDEAGAIVVDWGAVIAAVLLNGIMAVYAIFSGDFSPLPKKITAGLEASGVVEQTSAAEPAPPPSEDFIVALRGGQAISVSP